MIAALLGLLACGLGVTLGAPWWILIPGLGFLVPGRLGAALGAVGVLALLPWGILEAWQAPLAMGCGVLVAWAVLYRIGHAVPWVAVPWWIAGLAAFEAVWALAPPAGYWSGSDVAVRLRILVLAAAACIGLAVHYLPRYRNDALPASSGDGGPGTGGGRDETR